jgi:hypothetical protein
MYTHTTTIREEQPVFWLVWNDGKGLPKMRHPTEQSARAEAERLAFTCPGQQFHVLKLIASCAHNAVLWRYPVEDGPEF